MALVACRECGKEVSTQATSCPHCGAPVATAAVGSPVRTVELTSKKLKLHELISVLMLIGGLVWTIVVIKRARNTFGNSEPPILPFALFAVGFVWFTVTRFRIWWHHK